MHCPEFRETMQAFVDGNVDGPTRKNFARHLLECPACAALVEDAEAWNSAVRRTLDRKAPPELRAAILGEEAAGQIRPTRRREWLAVLKYVRQDLTPRHFLEVAAVLVVVLGVSHWLSRDSGPTRPFSRAGTVVTLDQAMNPSSEANLVTGSLELDGPFF